MATATTRVTTLLAEIVSGDGAVLLLPDPSDSGILVAYGRTAGTVDAVALTGQLRIDVTRPTSATAAAARLGEPVFVGDVERSTVIDIDLAVGSAPAAHCSCPCRAAHGCCPRGGGTRTKAWKRQRAG